MIKNNNGQLLEARKRRSKRNKQKTVCDSITHTTGDIDLNINHFNTLMGTTDTATGTTTENAEGFGEALTEDKRYVRRYYLRPQNIFCSNKAEIIKALIEIGNDNCSVYTLNNLGDDKYVSKLMNSDIIYYYDDRTGGLAGELVTQDKLTLKDNYISLVNSKYVVTGINKNTINIEI